jgi:hypothetical protein
MASGSSLGIAFDFGPSGSGSYPGGSGTTSFNGQTYNYCGASLSPGSQCALTLNFHPLMSATHYSSAVSVSCGDALGAVAPNAIRTINGDGT